MVVLHSPQGSSMISDPVNAFALRMVLRIAPHNGVAPFGDAASNRTS